MKAVAVLSIIRSHCDFVRQKGSHQTFRNRQGESFTFSFGKGDEISGGLVRKILMVDVLLSEEQAMKEVGMK
ncbi:type II toxin-antitoxin system HicA family toxin [Actinomycetes bacterium M1A6_2h]